MTGKSVLIEVIDSPGCSKYRKAKKVTKNNRGMEVQNESNQSL